MNFRRICFIALIHLPLTASYDDLIISASSSSDNSDNIDNNAIILHLESRLHSLKSDISVLMESNKFLSAHIQEIYRQLKELQDK